MAKQLLTRIERIERANAREADLVIAVSCQSQGRMPRQSYMAPMTIPPYSSGTNYNPNSNVKCPPGWGEDPSSN